MSPVALDHQAQQWVLAQVGARRMVSVTGLRAGGPPWLVHYETSDGTGSAVVRVGDPGAAGEQEREVRGIRLAAAGGVPVADVIATRADENATMLLIEYVRGSSVQPADLDPARPATLGAMAARISRVPVDGVALPTVTHPIPAVDFDELRRQSPPQPLLVTAQERIAASCPTTRWCSCTATCGVATRCGAGPSWRP
jgi:hypothetical protein